MMYPDLLDTFQYADTKDIEGMITDSGHYWKRSGACQPEILNHRLTDEHPPPYDNDLLYVASTFDSCVGADGNIYVAKVDTQGNPPPNATYWNGGSGNYAFIDVRQSPAYQYVDVEWERDLSNEGIVLSSSNRDYSLTWMTHFYFGTTGINLQMRGLGESAPTGYGSIAYPEPIVPGVVYRIGVRCQGSRFLFDLPGGSQKEWAHQKFADVMGRYLMYQPIRVLVHRAGCEIQRRRLVA